MRLDLAKNFRLVLALATSAWADVKCDDFWINLRPDNSKAAGGGTGYVPFGAQDGWIYYPDAPNGMDWWNQWFYDHPLDFKRWKEISYDIFVMPSDGWTHDIQIALNWSNEFYDEIACHAEQPPTSFMEEYIERYVIWDGRFGPDDLYLEGTYVIPDYNPEWVSIDVRYREPGGGEMVYFSGNICHECIPEPSTAVLLVFGALGLLVWRRRR